MNTSKMIRIGLSVLIVTLLHLPSALAVQGVLSHNANLYSGPSTSSSAIEQLAKGEGVTLSSQRRARGYYHVKAGDGKAGWVYSHFVALAPASPQSRTKAASREPISEPATADSSAQCDSALRSHVYHPERLIVKQQCIAVTGTIVDATANQKRHHADGVRHEPDGDSHGWIKLDPQYQSLLDKGNMDNEHGNLVFEIICRFPITQDDAKVPCRGATDDVGLPPVGSHVRIVGTYVLDTNHGRWNEIHPVTSITVVP